MYTLGDVAARNSLLPFDIIQSYCSLYHRYSIFFEVQTENVENSHFFSKTTSFCSAAFSFCNVQDILLSVTFDSSQSD